MNFRPRIVLDTNIVASAIFFNGTTTRSALEIALSTGIILASEATLIELFSLLNRPRLANTFSEQRRNALSQEYAARCQMITVHSTVHICRDARDNKFLELAIDGRADLILTGDNDLLALHPFEESLFSPPTQYLEQKT